MAAREAARTRPPRPTEPPLPEGVDAAELDPETRRELSSLGKGVADAVGRHLVAAGRLVEEDPQAAHAHALYARALAPRLAVVREAAGLTAYRVGDFAAALSDLRAARRMTARPDYLPIMADCERGLGRPARALLLAREADVKRLDAAGRIEMLIVESGARRDLGEHAAAVRVLEVGELSRDAVQPWTVRLWYAYADALLSAGRREEGERWMRSTAMIDEEGETDAEERLAELDG